MKYFFKLFSLAILLTASAAAHAEQETFAGQNENVYDNSRVTVDIRAGAADVQAHEYVYSGSYKVSELIWDTKRAYMAGGTVGLLLSPARNVRLNASVSSTVSKGNSTMDDYDWLVVGADWSHWSHHDNTKLEKGLVIDANLSGILYANEDETFKLGATVGYRRDQWQWGAVGGTFIYTVLPGFRNSTGTFPNVPVINYEQTINTPYVGASLDWTEGGFNLKARIIGSPLVFAEAVDHHYLRSLVFTDTFKQGTMLGGDVSLTYQLSKRAAIGIFYTVQDYFQNRGDTMIYDQIAGTVGLAMDSAAMSLLYQTFGISVNFRF